jgi:hypothetical protein
LNLFDDDDGSKTQLLPSTKKSRKLEDKERMFELKRLFMEERFKRKEEERAKEDEAREKEEAKKKEDKKKKQELEDNLLAVNRLVACIFFCVLAILNLVIWCWLSLS